MDRKIYISGLTQLEKWFLDIIWRIDSTKEFNDFKSSLHPDDLKIVEKLQYLLLIEYLDIELDKKDTFPYVEKLLKRYMK